MFPRYVYAVLIFLVLGTYGDQRVVDCSSTSKRLENQQLILKLTKHVAANHRGIIREVLPWRIRIESLSANDAQGPYLISLPDEVSIEQAISTASKDARIEYAEPNSPLHAADTIPNDPSFEFMWQLRNTASKAYVGKFGADIGAVRAWDITTGSSDIVVAILDTGVDFSHPDLAANAWNNPREVPKNGVDDDHNGFVDDVNGWNFLHDNNQLLEDPEVDYHGTHIAGIIGAVGNNQIGITGVAWRVNLMALKVLDGHGNKGLTANSIKAINYVIQQKSAGINVRIINASWVNEVESRAVRDAIEAAGRAGIVFVCAAGNDARNVDQAPIYPAARSVELDSLISVAATDRFDNLQLFSNYGRQTISVAAPGTDILGGWKLAIGMPSTAERQWRLHTSRELPF